jgi:hypothetical protein
MNTIKQRLFAAIMLFAATAFLFTSCKRDNLEDNMRSAEDNALAEVNFSDAQSIADEAAGGNMSSYKSENSDGILSNCATITHDTLSDPRVLTIDFGDVNCTCNDGRQRRGIIIVTYTGPYREPGHVHTITFDNYFVNDNQVLGTKTVTNNGYNNDGNLYYSIEVDGSIIRANDEGTITFVSSREREWIEGESTPERADDVYLVTGTASGTNSEGGSFTATITSALRRTVACHQFVSGTAEVTPANRPTRYIDFGDGSCDNQATVTVNGNEHIIQLH